VVANDSIKIERDGRLDRCCCRRRAWPSRRRRYKLYQRTMRPSVSRSGTLLAWNHRYTPSAWRMRTSASNGCPVSTERLHAAFTRARCQAGESDHRQLGRDPNRVVVRAIEESRKHGEIAQKARANSPQPRRKLQAGSTEAVSFLRLPTLFLHSPMPQIFLR
jgi:hypothetical protein